MKDLLKSDLYRVTHTKVIKVCLIVTLILAMLDPLITKLSYSLLSNIEGAEEALGAYNISGYSYLPSFLSVAGNSALVVPLFLICYFSTEFRDNTIRNKIIMGHSKAKIYLSLIITTAITCFAILLAGSIVESGLGFLLFKTGGNGFNFNNFITLICVFLIGYLELMVIILLGLTISLNVETRTMGVIVIIVLYLLSSIIMLLMTSNDILQAIFAFFPLSQSLDLASVVYLSDLTIVMDLNVPLCLLARAAISLPILLGGLIALGTLWFKKRELR